MSVRSIFLCLTAAAALGACWLPPFDPELSASQYTVDKLGDPVWSDKVTLDGRSEGGRFLPPLNASTFYRGLWIVERDGIVRLYDLFNLGFGFSELQPIYESPNRLGRARLLSMPPDPFLLNYAFVCFNEEGIRRVGIEDFNEVWNPLFGHLVGVGSAPLSAVHTSYFAASWDSLADDIWVEIAELDGGSGIAGSPGTNNVNLINAVPQPSAPGFFAVSPKNGWFYLSASFDGAARTYKWESDTDMPERLPVSKQLTGILSDGRLLADTGDELQVFDAEGDLQFSIRTGPLRFVHERYSGGKWKAVFTRTVVLPEGKDDKVKHLIEVYEIDTSDLKKLAK